MATIDTYTTVAGKPQIDKDPEARLDYPFDWSKWLAVVSDTIASVTWIIDASLTKTSESFTAVTATIWVSGGVIGTKCNVTCRIVTAGGRTEDRTIVLRIIAR